MSILSQLEEKQQRRQRFDLKSGIPTFDCKVQGDKFLDWLNFEEELFKYYDTLDYKKVRCH